MLDLRFSADRYGPYSNRLNHLLNALDGSYLRSDRRIPDCRPMDTIAFNDSQADVVAAYLRTGEARRYQTVVDETDALIDGFQSPLGMELLATVDWLLHRKGCAPNIGALRRGLAKWPGSEDAGARKAMLFNDRYLQLALERLVKEQQGELFA